MTHSNVYVPGFPPAPSRPVTRAWRWFLVLCLLSMIGCAQPLKPRDGEENVWSGRLALQVEDQASQSFSALFELRGSAQNGGLVLISPLGSRLAQLNGGRACPIATGAQRYAPLIPGEPLQDVRHTHPHHNTFQLLQGPGHGTDGSFCRGCGRRSSRVATILHQSHAAHTMNKNGRQHFPAYPLPNARLADVPAPTKLKLFLQSRPRRWFHLRQSVSC